MNKYRLLALVLIAVISIVALASCVPPEAPRPDDGPAQVAFEGTGCADVLNGGPWCFEFPRIIASDGSDIVSFSNNSWLAARARYHAVLLKPNWPYYNLYSLPPTQSNPWGYMRGLNPSIKFIAIMPAERVLDSFCHTPAFPHKCAMYRGADTAAGATGPANGWLAKFDDGSLIVTPPYAGSTFDGSQFIAWRAPAAHGTTSYGPWLANYYTTEIATDVCGTEGLCWDGLYFEGMSYPTGRTNFVFIDADENSTRDLDQWDRCTINSDQIDGYSTFFDLVATAGITVAGGEFGLSGLTVFDDSYPTAGHATASYIGSFGRESWPRCFVSPSSTSNYYIVPDPDGNAGGNGWDYSMRAAVRAEDRNVLNVLMADNALATDAAWGAYFPGTTAIKNHHVRRFVVASSLLLNAYAVPREDQFTDIYPCDECLVDRATGQAGTDIADLGWLGWPYYDATNTTDGLTLRQTISNTAALSGKVWMREYNHGLVVFNATNSTASVTIPAGFKYITAHASYGDTAHNPGGAAPTTLSVPAWDAYVLVRDTAATPTPGAPTYTPTATPTATPTVTPGGSTATPTPTATHTPTVTPTGVFGGLPTPTPTPTATPVACPAITATVDGNLAEWAGLASQALSASNAVYLRPSSPTPSTADLSARFWLACSGNDLLMAGIITDTVILDPMAWGSIFAGDTAEIQIDGLNDGITRPGQDDHDLFIASSGGVVYDFTAPISVTVATASTASTNWRFELRMPLAAIWPSLTVGSDLTTILTVYDRDTAGTPTPPAAADQVMIGPRWAWRIQ